MRFDLFLKDLCVCVYVFLCLHKCLQGQKQKLR